MYTECPKALDSATLGQLLDRIGNTRIGLIGDLCLDMYWYADMRISELSRETPHYPLPVVQEKYNPGGAGNVACNMAALLPSELHVIGCIGDDWRGNLLKRALLERNIPVDHIVQDESVVTNTYIKPMRMGISPVIYEDPRLDFENRSPISASCEERLLKALDEVAPQLDVLCVSDQMSCGCITPAVRKHICALGQQGLRIIVDSRNNAGLFEYVTLKPNDVEASRAFGSGRETDLQSLSEVAIAAARHSKRGAIVTLGENGCFVVDENATEVVHVPACKVEPPIDFCGAGDTFMSGFGCVLPACETLWQAAQIANLCSAVTIKKIATTGTATREEVVSAHAMYSQTNN